ncbi:MAG: hypothetical protein PVG03_17095, partial [Desulfarculaceae bacterium]
MTKRCFVFGLWVVIGLVLAGSGLAWGQDPMDLSGYTIADDYPLEIIQWTEYVDYDGDWAARGRVKNIGPDRLYFVKPNVEMVNRFSGSYLGSDYTYVNGSTAFTNNGVCTDST